MVTARWQGTYGHTAAIRSQAELAGANQRASPRGFEPLFRQETTVIAAGDVQDAVVGRAENRVCHDEAAIGRSGNLAQRTTTARIRGIRAQDLLQET